VIPLLFFATCGAPDISDDWIDDFEVVEPAEVQAVDYQVDGQLSGSDGSFSFEIPEGWQAVAGTDELIAEAVHLSSGTVVTFYRYDLGVEYPVIRPDCDWGYVDNTASSPFSCVETVLLTSCLLRESGARVQAHAFEHDGYVWQVEARFRVGYLAPGLEVAEELYSGVTC
jgi:hypothetical protein